MSYEVSGVGSLELPKWDKSSAKLQGRTSALLPIRHAGARYNGTA